MDRAGARPIFSLMTSKADEALLFKHSPKALRLHLDAKRLARKEARARWWQKNKPAHEQEQS